MFPYLVFISLIQLVVCNELLYKIPANLCDSKDLFYYKSLTIGDTIGNNTLPEILFITKDSMIWYSNDNINWISKSLPIGFTRYAVFRRNFYNDNSECGKDIPLSFVVISYDSESAQNLYNIYDPLTNNWTQPEISGKWPPIKDHYVFKNSNITDGDGMTRYATVGFIWSNHIVVFTEGFYNTIKLNQTKCDLNTDLSTTVENYDRMILSVISYPYILRYNDQFYMFKGTGMGTAVYEIYENGSISDTGKLTHGSKVPGSYGTLVTDIFGCDPNAFTSTPLPEATNGGANTDSVQTVADQSTGYSDYETTSDKNNENDFTSPSAEKSGKSKIGLWILDLLIVVIVIAIILSIVFFLWTKYYKKKDEKIRPVVDEPKPNMQKPATMYAKEDSAKSVRSGLDMDVTTDPNVGNKVNMS